MALRTVAITPGSGDAVSFDDQVQRVKVTTGNPGSQLDVSPDNPMPASDTSAQAKLDTIVTALSALLVELQGKTEPADSQKVTLQGLEGTDNDDEAPASGIALPVESYPMVYDPGAGTWSRQRGTKTAGVMVYSDDLSAVLLKAVQHLEAIASRLPMPDAAKRTRVFIDAQTANLSQNIAQWGGQNVATGAGAAGNGAPRVTPSQDTVAGSPQVFALLNSYQSVRVQQFRDRVTT